MIERGGDNMNDDYPGSLNKITNDEGAAWADGKHLQVSGNECIVADVSETVDPVSEFSHVNQVLELETCFQGDETSKLSDSEGKCRKLFPFFFPSK